MKLATLIFVLLTVGCTQPLHKKYIEWVVVPESEVYKFCSSDPYTSGCAKVDRKGCTIITPRMPIKEFTGYNHDMTSALWRELAHEVMHCFGYEHAYEHEQNPTPK